MHWQRDDFHLRTVRDEDLDVVLELIAPIYAEYGYTVQLDGLDAGLARPSTSLTELGGQGWLVTTARGEVAGSVGWVPMDEDAIELKRLYVASGHRRQGLARSLVELVEAIAIERGRSHVELYSDVLFLDAHRLYERMGYERLPDIRIGDDPSENGEYHYRRRVAPVA